MRHPFPTADLELTVHAEAEQETWPFELRWPAAGPPLLVIPDMGGQADSCPRFSAQQAWVTQALESLPGVRATWTTTWEVEERVLPELLRRLLDAGRLQNVSAYARSRTAVPVLARAPVAVPGRTTTCLGHPCGPELRVETRLEVAAGATHVDVGLDGLPGALESTTAAALGRHLEEQRVRWGGRRLTGPHPWRFPLARWDALFAGLLSVPDAAPERGWTSFSLDAQDGVRTRRWLGELLGAPGV